jgi:hypothetical protein
MPWSERGAPAPNWDEDQIERPKVGHAGEEVRVAREVRGSRSLDREADGLTSAEASAATMLSGSCAHRDLAEDNLLTHLDLPNSLAISPAQHRSGAERRNDWNARVEVPQRGYVEVVVMGVRDEHRVDVAETRRVDRLHATQVCYPSSQERVGQDSQAVKLEKDGRVSYPGHREWPGLKSAARHNCRDRAR